QGDRLVRGAELDRARFCASCCANHAPLVGRFPQRGGGWLAGDELVQLYVHQVKSSVTRPIKELRDFQRVTLKPGEARTVTFVLPAEKRAFYDVGRHGFVLEPGMFDVTIGS